MHTAIARKGMFLPVINMHINKRMRGQTVGNGGLGFRRHEIISAGNVNKRRGGDGVCLAQHVLDANTVIRDMRVAIGAAGRHIDHAPAEAKADGADPGATGVAQIINGGLQIGDTGIGIVIGHQAEGFLEICFIIGIERQIARLRPKQIGRQRHIALLRQPIGGGADIVIDAQNLLDADNAGFGGAIGERQICVKILLPLFDLNRLAHAFSSPDYPPPQSGASWGYPSA